MFHTVAVRYRYTSADTPVMATGIDVVKGDYVVVSTDRGTEIALATEDSQDIEDYEFRAASGRKGTAVRVASKEDLALAEELDGKAVAATALFRELIVKYKLDIKPVSTEFLFDGQKAIFQFASEGRVDFRDLVRELASEYHIRIDMRQMGVRDEARAQGGLSHCGQELCCARFSGQFQPVSIRMAKDQDLPLNPSRISGVCGRLMCCLRYETGAYKDFKSRAPKKGSLIETPEGLAKVIELDTPRERVTLRMENGGTFAMPLSRMGCDPDKCPKGSDGSRPNCIDDEAIQEFLHGKTSVAGVSTGIGHALEDGVVENNAEERVSRSASHRAERAGRGSGKGGQSKAGKSRRRKERQGEEAFEGGKSRGERAERARHKGRRGFGKAQQGQRSSDMSKPRPGQNSSGARRGNQDKASVSGGAARQQPQRKPRRRHPAGESGSDQPK